MSSPFQFSLRQLLVATALLGIAIALIRLAASRTGQGQAVLQVTVIEVAIICVIGAIGTITASAPRWGRALAIVLSLAVVALVLLCWPAV